MSNVNGTAGDDQVILGTTLTPSNIYNAQAGNDTVIGSAGFNLILGGDGDDHLDGRGGSDVILGQNGADVIRGGAGLDIVTGGAGNDTFVFHAGDLTGSLLAPDVILDFQGAGNTTGANQDVLELHGFSAGSTLNFVGTLGGATAQLYKINDAGNPSASGYVLINTDSAAHLDANDVHFNAKPTDAVTLNFEDIDPFGDTTISNGYHGFNIKAGGVFLNGVGKDDFPNSGYATAIDGNVGAYNPFAADPIVVTRTNGSDFIFDKVQIAAAADDSQVVTFKGYSDGFEVGSITTTIHYGVPTLVDADWGVIDTLVIDRVSTTGDHSPADDVDGSQFVLDNFHFVVTHDSIV
ncbi:hypothetical protein [Caulobacter soli]|uniref:hypothetical protein n=1 Tax=Caulobacter soli TaxID=2708539 RepID=UPI0013ED277D|nr:hypothetical protein [Caulobacter soli]